LMVISGRLILSAIDSLDMDNNCIKRQQAHPGWGEWGENFHYVKKINSKNDFCSFENLHSSSFNNNNNYENSQQAKKWWVVRQQVIYTYIENNYLQVISGRMKLMQIILHAIKMVKTNISRSIDRGKIVSRGIICAT
jgi:hypothetical protein